MVICVASPGGAARGFIRVSVRSLENSSSMATFRHLFGITQVVVLLLFSPLLTRGFDIDRNDNLVMYWGQVCESSFYSR